MREKDAPNSLSAISLVCRETRERQHGRWVRVTEPILGRQVVDVDARGGHGGVARNPSFAVHHICDRCVGLLRVCDVAEQLGVSTATVYKICKRGDIPYVRIVDSIRVRPADLAAFLAAASDD